MPTQSKEVIRNEILPFELTHEEVADKAKAIAAKSSDIHQEEAKFADVKKGFKSRIELMKQEMDALIDVVRSGVEERAVECIVKFNYEEGLVQYIHDGKVRKERRLESQERQDEMDFKMAAANDDSDDDDEAEAQTYDELAPEEVDVIDTSKLDEEAEEADDLEEDQEDEE